MTDPRTRLLALLMRLAPDLAEKLWSVRDVQELPADVRAAIYDVLGTGSRGWLGGSANSARVLELDD